MEDRIRQRRFGEYPGCADAYPVYILLRIRAAFTGGPFFARALFRAAWRNDTAKALHWRRTRLLNKIVKRADQRLHKILVAALFLAYLRQYGFPVRRHIRPCGHLRQRMYQRPTGLGGENIAPLFIEETTLKQQLDNPRPGSFGAQPVRGAEDFFQLFILHETGDAGHRREQRCVGKMTRRLGLPLYHLALFAEQLVAFSHHRQRRAVVLFITLLRPQQGAPARLRQKARFGDKFAVGDIQIDLTFTKYRIRAELHQILAGDKAIDIGFALAEIHF